jgi:hypothetical protein
MHHQHESQANLHTMNGHREHHSMITKSTTAKNKQKAFTDTWTWITLDGVAPYYPYRYFMDLTGVLPRSAETA